LENKYFNNTDSLFTITNNYPETIDIFVSKGFPQMGDKEQREKFGKIVTYEQAIKLKKMDLNTFTELLLSTIKTKRETVDVTYKEKNDMTDKKIKIQGLLPCPIRIPLLEKFESYLLKQDKSVVDNIGYELKAASMGLGWLKNDVINNDNPDNLSDIFISAGFDLFFEKDLMGKFKEKKVFKDMSGINNYNKDFENEYISLKDPKGDYSMLGVVPAVFLVNTELLNGRKAPESWEEILKDEFHNSISLPVSDFDLFNSILIHIYKKFGEDGIKKLSENLLSNLHPSQMVKSHVKPEPPTITIMPYFFTKTVRENSPMKFIWPKDGAIISPIFMLTKKDKENDIGDLAKYLASEEIGEVFAIKGLFPSVNPNVENIIPEGGKFMWVGWDYIYDNDIGTLIKKCEKIFFDKKEVK